MLPQNALAAGMMVTTVFVIAAGMYFLPSIIAATRSSPNTGSIIVLNLFLGWTLVGWVVSLALAVKSRTSQVVVVEQSAAPSPGPPSLPTAK